MALQQGKEACGLRAKQDKGFIKKAAPQAAPNEVKWGHRPPSTGSGMRARSDCVALIVPVEVFQSSRDSHRAMGWYLEGANTSKAFCSVKWVASFRS